MFKTTTLLVTIVLTIVICPPASSATISEPLPELETLYGSIAGFPFTLNTTFDFETSFSAINSATLHLEGSGNGGPGSTLHFEVELEGVATPQTTGLTDDPFEVDIPLLFDANVLDGMGSIQLGLVPKNVIVADVSFFISNATLNFDVIPEPSTFALALFSLVGVSFRRRRQA